MDKNEFKRLFAELITEGGIVINLEEKECVITNDISIEISIQVDGQIVYRGDDFVIKEGYGPYR